MNRPLTGPARDIALLLARLLLGTIMFAHGYQKLMIDGIGRTTDGFESMSIPVAIFSAAFVTVVEVVGSVLVVVGALIPVVAACYLVVMVGAAVFVHIPNGVFAASGGWELVGAIAALLLALAAAGSGRYGLDHVVRSRQERVAAADASSSVTVTFRPPAKHTVRPDHSARATSFVESAFVESAFAESPSDDPLPVRRPTTEPPAAQS